jgi:hypothetical protein
MDEEEEAKQHQEIKQQRHHQVEMMIHHLPGGTVKQN